LLTVPENTVRGVAKLLCTQNTRFAPAALVDLASRQAQGGHKPAQTGFSVCNNVEQLKVVQGIRTPILGNDSMGSLHI
jgi:hypothetical protein